MVMTRLRLLFMICVGLALACNACGGYSSNSSNCFISSLSISPASAIADHNLLPPGNSQQFAAFVGQASSGSCAYAQSNLTNVTWAVSDTTNASIGNTMTGTAQDNFGLATCLHSSNAPVTVTATMPAGSNSGHMATGTATLNCK